MYAVYEIMQIKVPIDMNYTIDIAEALNQKKVMKKVPQTHHQKLTEVVWKADNPDEPDNNKCTSVDEQDGALPEQTWRNDF